VDAVVGWHVGAPPVGVPAGIGLRVGPVVQEPGGLSPGLAAVLSAGVVTLVLLLLLTGELLRRYRRECHQLRARNYQLSLENWQWHEDFAAQTGELSALRRGGSGQCGRLIRLPAEAS
jgi:hypothetical protein